MKVQINIGSWRAEPAGMTSSHSVSAAIMMFTFYLFVYFKTKARRQPLSFFTHDKWEHIYFISGRFAQNPTVSSTIERVLTSVSVGIINCRLKDISSCVQPLDSFWITDVLLVIVLIIRQMMILNNTLPIVQVRWITQIAHKSVRTDPGEEEKNCMT